MTQAIGALVVAYGLSAGCFAGFMVSVHKSNIFEDKHWVDTLDATIKGNGEKISSSGCDGMTRALSYKPLRLKRSKLGL